MSVKKILTFLSLVLLSLFVYFSKLVGKDIFKQFDLNTTVRLQDYIPHLLDLPFSVLSIVGSAEVTTLIWLIILIYIFAKKFWFTFASLFLFFGSIIVEIFGKTVFYHPGPSHLFYRGVINFDLPSHYIKTEYSYPSGHVTRTTFILTFLLGWLAFRGSGVKRIYGQITLIFLLLAMLVSRIYLGEHWASDVIGGLLLGSSFGLLSVITIPKPSLKGKINS